MSLHSRVFSLALERWNLVLERGNSLRTFEHLHVLLSLILSSALPYAIRTKLTSQALCVCVTLGVIGPFGL